MASMSLLHAPLRPGRKAEGKRAIELFIKLRIRPRPKPKPKFKFRLSSVPLKKEIYLFKIVNDEDVVEEESEEEDEEEMKEEPTVTGLEDFEIDEIYYALRRMDRCFKKAWEVYVPLDLMFFVMNLFAYSHEQQYLKEQFDVWKDEEVNVRLVALCKEVINCFLMDKRKGHKKVKPRLTLYRLQFYSQLYFSRAERFNTWKEKKRDKKFTYLYKKIVFFIINYEEDAGTLIDLIVQFIMVNQCMDEWCYDPGEPFRSIKTFMMSKYMNRPQVKEFTKKSIAWKTNHLMELSTIVIGDMLYHWEVRGQPLCMVNLLSFADKKLPKLMEKLHRELEQIECEISGLQAIIQSSVFGEFTKEHASHIRTMLAYTSQYRHFLALMIEDSTAVCLKIKDVRPHYDEFMPEIRPLIMKLLGINIPAMIKIHKLYSAIAEVWLTIKRGYDYICLVKKLFRFMRKLNKNCDRMYNKLSVYRCKPASSKKTSTEEETDVNKVIYKIPKKVTFSEIVSEQDIEVIQSTVFNNYKSVTLEFEEYCPVTLVHRRGNLVKARRNLGIVMYKGLFYAFASRLARSKFMKRPEYYLTMLRHQMQDDPHLIILLRGYDLVPLYIRNKKFFCYPRIKPNVVYHKSCQTALPTVKRHMVPNYKWNEWQFRNILSYHDPKKFFFSERELRYISKLISRSTQTTRTCFRRDNAIQQNPQQDQSTQTKRSEGTCVSNKIHRVLQYCCTVDDIHLSLKKTYFRAKDIKEREWQSREPL